MGKKMWRKPELKTLKAGAAESAVDTIDDDADPQGIKNNS